MAKVKGKKGVAGGVNSHIRARLNYLHAAATYLQTGEVPSRRSTGPDPLEGAAAEDKESESVSARIVPQVVNGDENGDVPMSEESHCAQNATAPTPTSRNSNLSRVLISHMRGVSLKSQLRLPVEVKRSFCKRCETLLIPGLNSVLEIRNDSRGRSKQWADVLVVRCTTCGTEKRFPQTEKRSKRLPERRKMQQSTEQPVPVS